MMKNLNMLRHKDNGNAPKTTNEQITAVDIQVLKKERKAKEYLAVAIPKNLMRRFHDMALHLTLLDA
ncbi:hypothetical protein Tco_0226321 [Tanacetum coccineum]